MRGSYRGRQSFLHLVGRSKDLRQRSNITALESNPATWLADWPGKISTFRLRVASSCINTVPITPGDARVRMCGR